MANIRLGSTVEVNVADPFARKGYRFKGPATVHDPGNEAEMIQALQGRFAELHERASQ